MHQGTAIVPGSFDPVTNGHLDLIERAAKLFDQIVVAVGDNPEKTQVFPPDQRVTILQELIGESHNVSVKAYRGLTVDFARKVQADVIVRGIRDGIDLRDELQAANANLIVGGIETIFLLASEQYALTSSTFIKQIVALGGEESQRLSRLVPASVLALLRERIKGGTID